MPSISPDYSKNNELNLIEYESGKKDGHNQTGPMNNTNNQQHNGGGGTINYDIKQKKKKNAFCLNKSHCCRFWLSSVGEGQII